MAKRKKKSRVTNVTNLTAVYNLYITTSKYEANHFTTVKATKGASMDLFLRQEEMFSKGLYLSTKDANVIEMVHSFNFGQGKSQNNDITLKTYEPGMEVLKRFFFLFMQEEVTKIKYMKHTLAKLGKEIVKQEEYKERDRTSSPMYSWSHDVEGAKQELVNYAKQNAIGQKAYISYGIGDNLDEWAGPFQVILGKIDYDNNGKEETVTYRFTTDHIARQFTEKDLLAPQPGFKPVNFYRPTAPIAAFNYTATILAGKFGHWGDGIRLPSFTPSLHDNIVKLISFYLWNLGIKNHLIVLPNMDLMLASQVAQAISVNGWHKLFETKRDFGLQPDLLQSENYAEGLASYDTFNTAVAVDDDLEYKTQSVDALTKRLRKLYLTLFSWEDTTYTGLGELAEWLGVDEDYVMTLQDKIILMQTVFKRIGLRVNKLEDQSSDENPALINFLDASGTAQDQVNVGAALGPAGWISGEIIEGVGEWFGAETGWASKGYNYRVVEGNKIRFGDPWAPGTFKADSLVELELPFQHVEGGGLAREDGADYMAPLMDIVNSLIQAAGQRYCSIGYHWENDLKIVNLLKEKFGSGTAGGYRQNLKYPQGATTGPVPPPYDDNYFIFGDQQLINLFVYGEYASVIDFNKNARLSDTRFWEGVPVDFNKEIGSGAWRSRYFLDPFWNRIKNDLEQCTQSKDAVDYGVHGSDVAEDKDAGIPVSFATMHWTAEQAETYQKQFESRYKEKVHNSYFNQMRTLVKKPFLDMGHFNEYDLNPEFRAEIIRRLPDEFSFLEDTKDEETKKAIKDIFNLGPSFFIGNDTHGNILSYSFDNDQFIMSQFFGTIRDIYYNTTTRYSQQLAGVLDGQPSSKIVRAGLYAELDYIAKFGLYGNSLAKLIPTLEVMNKGRLATDLTDIILEECTGIERYNPRGRFSPTIAMMTLFMSIFKHTYRGIVTTVPMFEMSNIGALNRPSLVLLKGTGREQVFSEKHRSTSDFYSGLYKILGFRHSLGAKGAQSQFLMYKDIAGILGNESR